MQDFGCNGKFLDYTLTYTVYWGVTTTHLKLVYISAKPRHLSQPVLRNIFAKRHWLTEIEANIQPRN